MKNFYEHSEQSNSNNDLILSIFYQSSVTGALKCKNRITVHAVKASLHEEHHKRYVLPSTLLRNRVPSLTPDIAPSDTGDRQNN
jgi:hypothetical protein